MQVALAWLLQRTPNVLLIPGTSTVEHLRENLAAAALHFAGRDPRQTRRNRRAFGTGKPLKSGDKLFVRPVESHCSAEALAPFAPCSLDRDT